LSQEQGSVSYLKRSELMGFIPRSTRNRAVLSISPAAELISTLNGIQVGNRRLITKHCTGIYCITTGRCYPNIHHLSEYYIMVHFWKEGETQRHGPYVSVMVTVPRHWTPQIYLAAVYTTLLYENTIYIVETVCPWASVGEKYEITSVNNVVGSFFRIKNKEVLHNKLCYGMSSVSGGSRSPT